MPGLSLPFVSPNATHVYYVYGMILDLPLLGVSREWLVSALKAEGVTGLFAGYQNIHLLPLFQKRIAYGTHGFPWIGLDGYTSTVSYDYGICPIAESLHSESFFGLNLCSHFFSEPEVALVAKAFKKVWSFLDF